MREILFRGKDVKHCKNCKNFMHINSTQHICDEFGGYAVMLSIKPKWCELIASGRKTIEVRKSRPKLEVPFKCYIYCTKSTGSDFLWVLNEIGRAKFAVKTSKIADVFGAKDVGGCYKGNGKVIGEFVCDRVDTYDDDTIHAFSHEDYTRWNDYDLYQSCIHPEDFEEYAADEWLYGWHISKLVIYDEPRELSEFLRINRECWYADLGLAKRDCPECKNAECFVSRPPQSWCYVEEVGE